MKKDIAIVIQLNAEGIRIHKTLQSTLGAVKKLESANKTYTLYLDISSASQKSLDYIDSNKSFLKSFTFINSSDVFSRAAVSSNFIAYIPALGIPPKNWLTDSVSPYPDNNQIRHPRYVIYYDDQHHSTVEVHAQLSSSSEIIASALVAIRSQLLTIPSPLVMAVVKNNKNASIEDIRNRLIQDGTNISIVQDTALFIEAKGANKKHSPQSLQTINKISSKSAQKEVAKISKTPAIQDPILDILEEPWREAHLYDRRTFPNPWYIAHQTKIMTVPNNVSSAEYTAYHAIAKSLSRNRYNYILFAPWLAKGGADMFTINYANVISRLHPSKKCLVLTTEENGKSPWKTKLDSNVEFLDFGNITKGLSEKKKLQLLSSFIDDVSPQVIHNINSLLAYTYLRTLDSSTKKVKVVVTSFSQSTDSTGEVFGYSHTDAPFVYDVCDIYTSDNQAVLDMWSRDYGFNKNKLLLHRQAFDSSPYVKNLDKNLDKKTFNILWAARIAPEKIPEIIKPIGDLLREKSIHIDMYGTATKPSDISDLKKKHPVVRYKGPFDGIQKLPLNKYNCFLYTSMFDGTPTTLLEVGASKIPLIASAVGGIPALTGRGKGAIIIKRPRDPSEYVDAITTLQNNPGVGASISDWLYEEIKDKYSSENFKLCIAEMLELLNY